MTVSVTQNTCGRRILVITPRTCRVCQCDWLVVGCVKITLCEDVVGDIEKTLKARPLNGKVTDLLVLLKNWIWVCGEKTNCNDFFILFQCTIIGVPWQWALVYDSGDQYWFTELCTPDWSHTEMCLTQIFVLWSIVFFGKVLKNLARNMHYFMDFHVLAPEQASILDYKRNDMAVLLLLDEIAWWEVSCFFRTITKASSFT